MQFIATTLKGSGRGKGLGFPTINLNMDDIPDGIENGIHAGFVEFNGKKYMAAIHYGDRPVFKDTASFEVHIIDEDINIPPEKMSIDLIAHLRDVENFPSQNELIDQLHIDIAQARDILTTHAQNS